jgi:hypothetical protein
MCNTNLVTGAAGQHSQQGKTLDLALALKLQ